jgi:ribosomal protein S18 acetylase RimI-like enzyme
MELKHFRRKGGPTLKVRTATHADAPAIARIHVETWRSAYRGLVSAAYLSALEVEPRVRRWEQTLQQDRDIVLVAEVAGTVVGWISFGPCRDEGDGHEAEIYAVYVDSGHQRGGCGRALLLAAEAQLTALVSPTVIRISVWALERNDAARHFYERLGYVRGQREKQELIGGDSHTEIRYEKLAAYDPTSAAGTILSAVAAAPGDIQQ